MIKVLECSPLLSEEFKVCIAVQYILRMRSKTINKCFGSWGGIGQGQAEMTQVMRNPTILCKRINEPHQGLSPQNS